MATIRRRALWTPPDFSRYPSFDSGIELSEGSHPAGFQSSTSASGAINETNQFPQELDAPETRQGPAIYEAMRLQRERDRIRIEEVEPLKEKLKQLEADQLELTNLLTGLTGPSGATKEGVEEAPPTRDSCPSSADSQSLNRSDTVRWVGPKAE
jgi:hypothetical protein